MGEPFQLITLLIAAVIGWHVVSATDCRESNCQFDIREECQTSRTVICSMKDGPMKQINITATSFPRGVRDIKISDAEMITFEPDSIASLTSLKDIEITNVSTLILLPRSLARDSEAEQITVTIRSVKSLQLHPEAFHGWRGDSKITIEGVNDCQMQQGSMADAQLRSLSLTKIQSLIVQDSRLVNDSKKFNQFNHDSLDEMTDSIITQSNSLIFQAIQSRLMDPVIQLNHDSSHYQRFRE